ncbi:glycosyltransferase family 4 protein [Candidatus Acetothermia bacterium]|jgi:glycosyltransferase involved in cell wall biosynthesis|nr:glycosyltransferase family 4 protein [Candidatus Acetothermia bacterium]
MNIKMLIVLPSSKPGGVQEYVRSLVNLLPQDAFELHLAAPGHGSLFKALETEKVFTHHAPIDYSFASLPLSTLRFRHFVKAKQFDLVHLHTVRAGLLGCLAALGASWPIVYTGHGWRFEQKPNPVSQAIFYRIERFICGRATSVVFLSERDRKLGIESRLVDEDKAVLIRTRINATRFQTKTCNSGLSKREEFGIPSDAIVIGTVARVVYEKDPATFLRTAARLKPLIQNVYFTWVGDGELKEEVLELSRRLGIEDRFMVTGYRDVEEIPALLDLMDVFLLASRIETFPLSILEAMAARRPVVATDVGGISEVVRHGITGWLFPPGDDAQAAQLVLKALEDREKRHQTVENACQYVSEFYSPPEEMAKEYQTVYEQVIQRMKAGINCLNP